MSSHCMQSGAAEQVIKNIHAISPARCGLWIDENGSKLRVCGTHHVLFKEGKTLKKAILILVLIALLSTAFVPTSEKKLWNPEDFRVMAYSSELPFDDPIEDIQFEKLTHIIYAFLIPRADGTLLPIEKPERLKALVKEAHKHHVKVSVAIGGWSYQDIPLAPNFEALAASETSRRRLVEETLDFVDTYKLDGVELDWEYPLVGESAQNYEALVVELNGQLSPRNKLFSAAVSGAWTKLQGTDSSNGVSTRCLNAFDWITVMSYDLYGAQHAPLWYADTSIEFWANRGMPREKIILGIPLYARPSWKQYRDLVAESRGNAWRDYAPGSPLESWYNGLATLKEKTRMALLNAGGVMLFDVHEDTQDATSVLSMVDALKLRAAETDPEVLRQEVTGVMNSHEVQYDARETGMPFINPESHLMMPVKKTLEAMGATVTYSHGDETIRVEKTGHTLIIALRSNIILADGKPLEMEVPPLVIKERAYLPVRYLTEPFGYAVEWLNGSRTVLMDEIPGNR